jgi:poly(beta-D-mannuronate) lyase
MTGAGWTAFRAAFLVLLLAGCAASPVIEPLRGPFSQPGPAQPLSARPCPTPSPPLRSLMSTPFYTDGAASTVDPARLAADTEASRPLREWLDAIQRPTERWVALRDPAEADCALRQIEAWAEAGALLGVFNWQGAYHRKWALSGAAIAYLALRDAPAATPERQARIGTWLAEVARSVAPAYERAMPRQSSGPREMLNNHVAWAGLAVAAAGVAGGDRALLRWGMARGEIFLAQVTPEGAHPQELARGRMALHYHLFALQAAAPLGRIGEAAGEPLSPAGRAALDRFARFTYAQALDPSRIAVLAGAAQSRLIGERPWLADMAQGLEIWGGDPAIRAALQPFRPYRAPWLGGGVTLLWGG